METANRLFLAWMAAIASGEGVGTTYGNPATQAGIAYSNCGTISEFDPFYTGPDGNADVDLDT